MQQAKSLYNLHLKNKKKYCDETRVVDVIPRVCMSLYGGFADLRGQAGCFLVACYHATVLGLTLFVPPLQ